MKVPCQYRLTDKQLDEVNAKQMKHLPPVKNLPEECNHVGCHMAAVSRAVEDLKAEFGALPAIKQLRGAWLI